MNPDEQADFLIVTALEEEREAVLGKLPGWRRLPPTEQDVRVYYLAEVLGRAPDGSKANYRLVLVQPLGMGRVEATAATADALKRWKPAHVLLVGIAGGIAQSGVRLGDLLIADQIVDYELQRVGPGDSDVQVRYTVHRADARLLGAAMNLRGTRWQRTKAKRPGSGSPKRRIGPIATGDKVVAREGFLSELKKNWAKIIGVEMEAGGVATACFQESRRPGFFMVRAVSDLADERKATRSVRRWRSYACDLAASFAIELIKVGSVPFSEAAVSRLPAVREPLPKTQQDRFTVAIARLENDKDQQIAKLIIEALRGMRGVRIVLFDRLISLEGPIPEECEHRGHSTAHEYLDESGADVLIWGTVVAHDGRTAPRLFFTNHLLGRRSTELYVLNDFQLPQIFWDDLADVLRVTVAIAATISLDAGRRHLGPQLDVLAWRLRNLIAARDRKAWSDRDYAAMQAIFGEALVVLGSEHGRLDLLGEAKVALSAALNAVSRDSDPFLWAASTNVLARAHLLSGQVMIDDDQLREAERLLKEVAQESALDRSPRLKAAIYASLGYVLYRLGERDVDTNRLRAALRAFGTAYRIVSRLHSDPASILVGMGITLKELGDRIRSACKLAAAMKVYDKALVRVSKDNEPVNWARTRYNMASVLHSIGRCEGRSEPIAKAVEMFREVLKESDRIHIPQDRAGLCHNLAMALADLGEKTADPGRLREAIELLRASVAERTREHVPLWWGATQFALGSALLALGKLTRDVASIRSAMDALRLAEQAWTSHGAPRYRRKLVELLAEAQAVLVRLGVDVDEREWQEIESALDELLLDCDPTDNPVQWASRVARKANAITGAAMQNGNSARLGDPVALYQSILRVISVERYPFLWSSAMFNLGYALRNFGVASKNPTLVRDALDHHLQAWAVIEGLSTEEIERTFTKTSPEYDGTPDSAEKRGKSEVAEAIGHDLSALRSLLQSNDYTDILTQYSDQLRELDIH